MAVIDAAQAIAAPERPIRGMSTTFNPTLIATASAMIRRFAVLPPAIKIIVALLPVEESADIPKAMIVNALAPAR